MQTGEYPDVIAQSTSFPSSSLNQDAGWPRGTKQQVKRKQYTGCCAV